MAEYGSMFATSAVAVVLYLGAWHTGVIPGDLTDYFGPIVGNLFNASVLIVKTWLLVFVMMWVRWTLPRLRIDQVMLTCLKYLLPLSCVLLLGASLYPLLWNTFIPNVQVRSPKVVPADKREVRPTPQPQGTAPRAKEVAVRAP
jgi:NADH-quinone oxidoreductase subunit H